MLVYVSRFVAQRATAPRNGNKCAPGRGGERTSMSGWALLLLLLLRFLLVLPKLPAEQLAVDALELGLLLLDLPLDAGQLGHQLVQPRQALHRRQDGVDVLLQVHQPVARALG